MRRWLGSTEPTAVRGLWSMPHTHVRRPVVRSALTRPSMRSACWPTELVSRPDTQIRRSVSRLIYSRPHLPSSNFRFPPSSPPSPPVLPGLAESRAPINGSRSRSRELSLSSDWSDPPPRPVSDPPRATPASDCSLRWLSLCWSCERRRAATRGDAREGREGEGVVRE